MEVVLALVSEYSDLEEIAVVGGDLLVVPPILVELYQKIFLIASIRRDFLVNESVERIRK